MILTFTQKQLQITLQADLFYTKWLLNNFSIKINPH